MSTPANVSTPASAGGGFRPVQQEIMRYRGGKLGIAAVPGSGKTFTLSHLAARLVARIAASGRGAEQEVLIVTFSNSAANSIRARVGEILGQTRAALPYVGYRVRTLHGLAHDIVRERPALVGLAEDFQIVDERVAAALLRDAVESWLRAYGDVLLNAYLDPEHLENEATRRRLRTNDIPDLALNIAGNFIRQAKDRRLTHTQLRHLLEARPPGDLPLAQFGVKVYEDYQRSLSYRGAVDFDDLVRLALLALENDADYLARLQYQYPYILEDEAQDSSQLQEVLLSRLSNEQNWVRMGDPNQAINTTFTTASPRYLREFVRRPDVTRKDLDVAGRSAPPIIDLANRLIDWTMNDHPVPTLREALSLPHIQPTPPGDAQGNPPAEESRVVLYYKPGDKISPERELELVANSCKEWVAKNPHRTVAALVPENAHGFKLAELLRERGVEYEELLRSSSSTRDTAGRLQRVLEFLAQPAQPGAGERLATLYRDLWWGRHLGRDPEADPAALDALLKLATEALTALRQPERFLWPESGADPVAALPLPDSAPLALADDVRAFREVACKWQRAAILPIDQLVLTVAGDIYTQPAEIALGYKLAQLLRGFALEQPAARLPEFVAELRTISQNERRFLGFEDDESGYAPKPGRVTIATMHAAKGLEWDRVYLLAVNNYSFPSAQSTDRYMDEKWFLRDRLNLGAEAVAQLHALIDGALYAEGAETAAFREAYAAERLRLFYVGITRAKRELVVTWNMGRFYQKGGTNEQSPALPFVALWAMTSGGAAQQ
jgi:DNA helicase-2/ATP-dependent DNA helicase PcrA